MVMQEKNDLVGFYDENRDCIPDLLLVEMGYKRNKTLNTLFLAHHYQQPLPSDVFGMPVDVWYFCNESVTSLPRFIMFFIIA